MKQYWNKKDFIKEFTKRSGYYVSYVGFAQFENKGFVHRIGFYRNGKQIRPLYDESSMSQLLDSIEVLKDQGKLKLRVA